MTEQMIFPFSAVVGQMRMKRALLVNAINPRIGGVLIMGGRGSAKSTVARGLARLMPPVVVPTGCLLVCDPMTPEPWCPTCGAGTANRTTEERPTPFISLPLGATQDSVVGTLDLEQAVTQGKKRWEPGLLARVHRGLLYIDEVNLLPDHLVDLLLDVAASGINTVEREGISLTHSSRFILIGTMNPEEGDLRPQLLDRFGLCVEAEVIEDTGQRAEVVTRTLAFESDPETFCAQWETTEHALRQQLIAARERLSSVSIPSGLIRRISELCCRERVEGLRADIIIQKTSLALASWDGRELVNDADVEEAAAMTLLHRRRPGPVSPPSGSPRPSPGSGEGRQRDSMSQARGPSSEVAGREPQAQQRIPPGETRPMVLPQLSRFEADRARMGRNRDRKRTVEPHGHVTGFMLPVEHPIRELALAATLRAAAGRRAMTSRSFKNEGRLALQREDLRVPTHQATTERLYLFVVDTSGSMTAWRRMERVKGLLIGLLETAYRKRDRVAVLTFAGDRPTLVLPPTRSVRRAQRLLHDLPVGGRTPMAEALQYGRVLALRYRMSARDLQQAIIIVSDGRSNVSLNGTDPLAAVTKELALFVRRKLPVVLLDAEDGPTRLGLMTAWGKQFGFAVARLGDLAGVAGARLVRSGIQATAS
jgi:magnesium chelatase subunit D